MVRWIAFFAGLAFVGVAAWSLLWGAVAYVSDPPVKSVEHRFHLEHKDLALASDGPFGKFDRQQLQRGFQVYKEVCSGCHSLNRVAFRDLAALGYEEPTPIQERGQVQKILLLIPVFVIIKTFT